MTQIRLQVVTQEARAALGMAYVKGYADDPLPVLSPAETRDLVRRTLTSYGLEESWWWADKLRVYPSESDPRSYVEVVEAVQAWAIGLTKKWNPLRVTVDPAEFREE